jgi:hypothetical protein
VMSCTSRIAHRRRYGEWRNALKTEECYELLLLLLMGDGYSGGGDMALPVLAKIE